MITYFPRRPLLGELGQVYVTLAAARSHAEARGFGEEEARGELALLLHEAHRVEARLGKPELWRYRSRSHGVDVSALVARYGRILVVVAASTRRYWY